MGEEAILVTGATGYIAAHVVKLLMEKGYRVRGTVRSLKNTSRLEPLRQLVKNPAYPLELVEADLTKDEGWDKAMEGCKVLMHTASPFPNVMEKTYSDEELVTPAREGTLRALKAAVSANIKKVVLTSSCVAIVGSTHVDEEKLYSEKDWTDPEDPTVDPYSKSKVVAEKAAWDYLKGLPEDKKFELAVINPSLVMGPVLMESNKGSTSASIMTQILAKRNPAYPKYSIYFCDVRDVAMAHLQAMTIPEAFGHRHIINARTMWFKDLVEIVVKEFGPQGYCIPNRQLPYTVCWIVSLFNKQMRDVILPRYGKTINFTNRRMVEVLGISPIPADKTLTDMAYSLIDLGLVKKTKDYKGTPRTL